MKMLKRPWKPDKLSPVLKTYSFKVTKEEIVSEFSKLLISAKIFGISNSTVLFGGQIDLLWLCASTLH